VVSKTIIISMSITDKVALQEKLFARRNKQMNKLHEVTEQIRNLTTARDFLKEKYDASEFHKKKEKFPQSAVPPAPEDEEIYKLLTAIQQLDKYIKELQDVQLKLLKQEE
jgi:hypothetical protein